MAWPMALSAFLVAVIGALRLVSKNAPRASRRYRLRVALLAMLVGLTGGMALPGCEADAVPKDAIGPGEQEATCYAPDVVIPRDVPPEVDAICYKDIGSVEPEVDVRDDDDTMTCYLPDPPDWAEPDAVEPAPEVVPEVTSEPTPEVVPDAPPEGMPEAVTPEATSPDGDETILCYEPLSPDTTDKG